MSDYMGIEYFSNNLKVHGPTLPQEGCGLKPVVERSLPGHFQLYFIWVAASPASFKRALRIVEFFSCPRVFFGSNCPAGRMS
jgi:hypothetical protein